MDLFKTLETSADLVPSALNDDKGRTYVESLKKLIPEILSAGDEDIKKLPYDENTKNTILTDRALIAGPVNKEKDQVSLVSTLVTYIACGREGMTGHSRKYMDRVTQLRHKINEYYGEAAQQFCGS